MRKFVRCKGCKEIVMGEQVESTQHMVSIYCPVCKKASIYHRHELLRAISIKQPFAWMVVNGFKTLENRNTLKNFTGEVLIHTGKKWDNDWLEKMKIDSTTLAVFKAMPVFTKAYKYGGIVGVATFTGSVTESTSGWFVGKYAFTIEGAKEIPFVPCKGSLGFFIPTLKLSTTKELEK